jgi:hypothetical protein
MKLVYIQARGGNLLSSSSSSTPQVFDVNGKDSNGESALHVATYAWSKNVRKVIEVLLEAEAQVHHTK